MEPLLSIIAPAYNESPGISEFCGRLRGVLDAMHVTYEVIVIDDGSDDGTGQVLGSIQWPELRPVYLSRNVGHQLALEAGLSLAQGTYVITMDADGQHPPELIPEMFTVADSDGLDVVYTQRKERRDDRLLTRTAALTYYRAMRFLTGIDVADSQADFRLMSRKVVRELSVARGHQVLRLLLPAIGYRSTSLEFEALPRISGESRYGLRRQTQLAIDSTLTFSSKPLRLVAAGAIILALASLAWLGVVLVTFARGQTVAGWASVMSALLIVGSLTLLSLAIIGEYIARIHDVVQRAPTYSVYEKGKFKEDPDSNVTL